MAAESNEVPWLAQAAARWGHYGSTGLTTSVAATIALILRPPNATGAAALIAPAAILFLVLVSWRAMRHHDRRLCESCVRSMPLNLTEMAARYRLRFAVAHAIVVKPVGIAYLLVLVGSDIVLMRGTGIERIAWAAIQLTMVYLVFAYSSHRRFQPWCPHCHGGDGERDRATDKGPLPLNDQSR